MSQSGVIVVLCGEWSEGGAYVGKNRVPACPLFFVRPTPSHKSQIPTYKRTEKTRNHDLFPNSPLDRPSRRFCNSYCRPRATFHANPVERRWYVPITKSIHRTQPYPSTDDSGPVKCNADDVETIKVALWTEENNRRNLQFGPNDCPCDCECEGWVPGYCYWWFCPWVVPGWDRRALSEDLDEDTPLSECADHLVVVNNVLNSAIPMVSEGCQDVLRSERAFSCQ